MTIKPNDSTSESLPGIETPAMIRNCPAKIHKNNVGHNNNNNNNNDDDDDDDKMFYHSTATMDEESRPLLTPLPPSAQRKPWWVRVNRCGCRNGRVVLFLVMSVIISNIIMIPIVYYVIIPAALTYQIQHIPPIQLEHIGIDRLYPENQSIAFAFQAFFDMTGPGARFAPARYEVGIVEPFADGFVGQAGEPMGRMTASEFRKTRWTEPLRMDFTGMFDDFSESAWHRSLALAGEHLDRVLRGVYRPPADMAELQADKNRFYRLRMRGQTDVTVFGATYRQFPMQYDLPLAIGKFASV